MSNTFLKFKVYILVFGRNRILGVFFNPSYLYQLISLSGDTYFYTFLRNFSPVQTAIVHKRKKKERKGIDFFQSYDLREWTERGVFFHPGCLCDEGTLSSWCLLFVSEKKNKVIISSCQFFFHPVAGRGKHRF